MTMNKPLKKLDKNVLVRLQWPMFYRIAKTSLDLHITRNEFITRALENYFKKLEDEGIVEKAPLS